MIVIFFLLCQNLNLDSLYDYAKIGLVKFNAEKDSARNVFINLGQEGIDYLVKHLDTKYSVEASALEQMLKRMGKPAIEKILSNIDYRGSNEESRYLKMSLRVIGETFKHDTTINGDFAVPRLSEFIEDYDWRVRSATANALGMSRSKKALPWLLKCTQDSINIVRKSATAGLKDIAGETEVAHLIDLLQDDFYGVRFSAHEVLVKIGAKSVAKLITRLNRTEELELKCLLIKTLGKIENKAAKKVVQSYHKDKSPIVRFAVYEVTSDKKVIYNLLKTETDPYLKNFLQARIDTTQ